MSREIDRLVSENIFGYDQFVMPRHYSTDIAAAFEVAEKTEILKDYGLFQTEIGWFVGEVGFEYEEIEVVVEAAAAPMAICLAALKAKGVEVRE